MDFDYEIAIGLVDYLDSSGETRLQRVSKIAEALRKARKDAFEECELLVYKAKGMSLPEIAEAIRAKGAEKP